MKEYNIHLLQHDSKSLNPLIIELKCENKESLEDLYSGSLKEISKMVSKSTFSGGKQSTNSSD